MKKIFTFLFVLFAAHLVKAGTFGLGDYVWKDDGSQATLGKNAAVVKNDRKPIDLEMSLGMWAFFKTQSSGTIVLQYARGNANAAPYVAGAGGTTQAQSPNFAMTWVTINTDSVGKDWVLARNFSSLTEGDYTPSGLADYSGIGAYAGPTATTHSDTLNFGGKALTSNANGITLDGTTVPGFVSGNYNYIKGVLKFAIMPGSTVQANSVYTFRLFSTTAMWDGNNASGRTAGDVTINFNTYEGTQNEIMGHASEGNPNPNAVNGGNHFDHGMPFLTTGPNILNSGLPVKWSADGLQASVVNSKVELTWTTESEINNKDFVIQRSADGGKNYTNIGTANSKAVNGNSSVALSYDFTDASPVATALYRIEQVDLDGTNDYSNIVNVSLSADQKLSVYPNPVVSSSLLNVKGAASGSAYRVVGINGVSFAKGVISASGQVDVSHLTSGVYILKVSAGNGSSSSVTFIKK